MKNLNVNLDPIFNKLLANLKKRKGKFKKVAKEKREFGKGFIFSARSISVPARPFLVLSDEGMSEIKQAIVNYIKK